jgi:hypothetical protein
VRGNAKGNHDVRRKEFAEKVVVIDITTPLDLSKDMPPTPAITHIQIPAAKLCVAHMLCDALVKAFNIGGNYIHIPARFFFLAARRPYLIGYLITVPLTDRPNSAYGRQRGQTAKLVWLLR